VLGQGNKMNEELREQILQLIREELTIDVTTESNYTGGLDGSDLYQNSYTVKLMLGNEVISFIGLN
jgi:hypothetical protein